MVNDPDWQVRERLAALVGSGAEIEQRSIEGEVLFVGAVARDTARIQRDGDVIEVWLRPLQPPVGTDEDTGTPVFFMNDNEERPLRVARLDLIGDNVGFQHPTGTYSVVRPASPDVVGLLDAWDEASEAESFLY